MILLPSPVYRQSIQSICYITTIILLCIIFNSTPTTSFTLSVDNYREAINYFPLQPPMFVSASMDIRDTSVTHVQFDVIATYSQTQDFGLYIDQGFGNIKCYVMSDDNTQLVTIDPAIDYDTRTIQVGITANAGDYGFSFISRVFCGIYAPIHVYITMTGQNNIEYDGEPKKYFALGLGVGREFPLSIQPLMLESVITLTFTRSSIPLLKDFQEQFHGATFLLWLHVNINDGQATLQTKINGLPTEVFNEHNQPMGSVVDITDTYTTKPYWRILLIQMDSFDYEHITLSFPCDGPLQANLYMGYIETKFTTPLQEPMADFEEVIRSYIIPIPTTQLPHISSLTSSVQNQAKNHFTIDITLPPILDGQYYVRPTYQFTSYGAMKVDSCTLWSYIDGETSIVVDITHQHDYIDQLMFLTLTPLLDAFFRCEIIISPLYQEIVRDSFYLEEPIVTWVFEPYNYSFQPGIFIPITTAYERSVFDGLEVTPIKYQYLRNYGIKSTSINSQGNLIHEQLEINIAGYLVGANINIEFPANFFFIDDNFGSGIVDGVHGGQMTLECTTIEISSKRICKLSTLLPSTIDPDKMALTSIHKDTFKFNIFRILNDDYDVQRNDISFVSPTGIPISNVMTINVTCDSYNIPAYMDDVLTQPFELDTLNNIQAFQYSPRYLPLPILETTSIVVLKPSTFTIPISLAHFNRLLPTDTTFKTSIWADNEYYKSRGLEILADTTFSIQFSNAPFIIESSLITDAFNVNHVTADKIINLSPGSYYSTIPPQSAQNPNFAGYFPALQAKISSPLDFTFPMHNIKRISQVNFTAADFQGTTSFTTSEDISFYVANDNTETTYVNVIVEGTSPFILPIDTNPIPSQQPNIFIKPGETISFEIKSSSLLTTAQPTIILYHYQSLSNGNYATIPSLIKKWIYNVPINTETLFRLTLPTNFKVERAFFSITYQQQLNIQTRSFFSLPRCFQETAPIIKGLQLHATTTSTSFDITAINESGKDKDRSLFITQCQNDGVCVANGTCQCKIKTEGDYCQHKIYDEVYIPMEPDACDQCMKSNTAECTSEKCQCRDFYTGPTCTEPRLCTVKTSELCYQNNGFVPSIDGRSKCGSKCTCYNFFVGDKCSRCPLACQNGGIPALLCDKCRCDKGYSNTLCQCRSRMTADNSVELNGYNPILLQWQSITVNKTKKEELTNEQFLDLEYEYKSILDELSNEFSTAIDLQSDSFKFIAIHNQQMNSTWFSFSAQYACDSYNPTVTDDILDEKWLNVQKQLTELNVIKTKFIFPNDDEPILKTAPLVETPSTLNKEQYINTSYSHFSILFILFSLLFILFF